VLHPLPSLDGFVPSSEPQPTADNPSKPKTKYRFMFT